VNVYICLSIFVLCLYDANQHCHEGVTKQQTHQLCLHALTGKELVRLNRRIIHIQGAGNLLEIPPEGRTQYQREADKQGGRHAGWQTSSVRTSIIQSDHRWTLITNRQRFLTLSSLVEDLK